MTDISKAAVDALCHAAPFADNTAGIPQMVSALRALRAALDEAEARAVKAEAERDAAYAKGFSDAETEISATAIGQQNIALHYQLSRVKAERDAANALLREAVSKIQSLYDGIAPLGEGRFAEADETVQAARAHLGAKP